MLEAPVDDTWTKALLVLLPVLAGAVIGIFPMLLLERLRAAAALRTRWDDTLHKLCAQFAACTRRIIDIAEDHEPATSDITRQHLDEEHRQLQVLMAEVRLLGNAQVQSAARMVVRDSWALRMEVVTGTDPRSGDFPGRPPRARTLDGLFAFYLAARTQLQVPNADDLAPVNPPIANVPDTSAR
jgi:hypothetical protein